jgi:long-chain acyl-CoA synthetase
MGVRDYTLYDFLRHNAAYAGVEPAVIDNQGTTTYRQLLERVDRLSAGLARRGISKGDRICILAQNSAAYLELYGACAKTGAVAYPLNWRLTSQEIREVINLADPKVLAVGAGQASQLQDSDLHSVEICARIGPGSMEGFIPLEDLYLPSPAGDFEVGSQDPFVIISTAAVAGVPRGAVLTHANLALGGYLLANTLGLRSQDRNLAALPLYHITGLGLALSMFQVGGANIILEKFDPVEAVQLMDAHNVTLMTDFPPVLSLLLEARAAVGARWEKLRCVVGLDAPDVIQRLYRETNARFWVGYGQSETCGGVTLARAEEKPGSAGKPLPLVRLRCVDEAGQAVPVGEVGEIVIQGPLVFSGYWRDPDATQYTLRDGWHHTGDLGKLDEDGYVYFAGRKPEKDLIKTGGENVYSAEVEHVIQGLPGVAAVCVIGVPDQQWGEAVKAVIQMVPGESLTEEQVRTAVTERIASYKKPRHVLFVDRLPVTAGGEIDRAAVKAAYGSG